MAVLRLDPTDQKVKVAVVKASDVVDPFKGVEGLIKFTLRRPADKVLSANQFNSILYTKKANDKKEYAPVQLTFNQDSNHPDFPNVFSQNPINAEAIDGEDFVYLYNLDVAGKKHYLHVDTAYTNDKGVKFLKLAAVEKADQKFGTVTENNGTLKNLEDLGKFALYYDAEKKELYIRAKKVYDKPDNVKYWNKLTAANATDVDASITTVGDDNWVKLQNLVGGEYRIITIGKDPVNTKISFGFGACDVVASNKTSIADGVYVFYDKAGTSVLGMPIHRNGDEVDSNGNHVPMEWVKLDTQDPQHMPAFQWVVLKNQTDDKYAPTSRITLTNREFPEYTATIQLVKDEDGNITADNGKVFGLNVKYFKNITPVKNISDPYMGYRYLDKDSLTVTAYGFNYLHPFSQSTWVETRSNGVLTVSETESPERFTLKVSENSTATAYGFEVTDKVKKRIEGLAQLKRIAYSIESGNSYMTEGSNDKYVLKARKADKTLTYVDSFFLKENNHYEAEHYYALVRSAWNETTQTRYIGDAGETNKVGAADDGMTADLKVQLLNETRTSAFAVKVMDAPLYRRFNNVELEGNVGDAPDTLRFYEKYRGEYLQMEANENFIVDKDVKYLGIDDASKSEVGLSFIVDTAWVNRGLGYIKPQYLISIDRDDIAGTKGQACTEEGPHFDHEGNVTDAEHCVHATPATPAMNFGWYLVNFEDSASQDDKYVGQDAYKWADYTRAGFVKAIHYGDKLYVLRDQFKDIQKADINEALLEKIEAANKTLVAKGEHPYVIDLTGDEHKYVTWSMRYINPGTEDQSFLMESMKAEGEYDIAPNKAAWLKMQNGCLVLSKADESDFNNAKTGGDDALIFDVEFVENDEIATENESINATEVSVIATDGGVYIKNAAGKNVVISTILGQIVANEVLTSDNATIAVPAGIAIVSVDGEEAVKVSVK